MWLNSHTKTYTYTFTYKAIFVHKSSIDELLIKTLAKWLILRTDIHLLQKITQHYSGNIHFWLFWGLATLIVSCVLLYYHINVTSFSSIPYFSNMRSISKMYLEQNSHSITLDIHASTVEGPPHPFHFKPHSANKL